MGGLAVNTIHTMDCIEGMRRLPAGSVDVIVTSPPYNIGKDYNSYDDRKPREDYLGWLAEFAAGAVPGLADDGSFLNRNRVGLGKGVDIGRRRIIKTKNKHNTITHASRHHLHSR